MRVDLIAGARPNFMKISPIIDAINKAKLEGKNIDFRLIHTGQHYDKNMSGSFFEQLGIPDPDVNLGAGGGSQAEQAAAIMIGYEKLLLEDPSDLCLVVGDVTSTMACAIAAQKLCIPVAHVEAGIRSGDWTMPEEINRMVTDSITNYFFTTSSIANENLYKTGIEKERVFFVGNTMIDTLVKHRPRFKKPSFWDELGLEEGKYLVMTLHRPANVDQEEKLAELMKEIIAHTQGLPLIFPVHPRTKKIFESLGIVDDRLHIVDPLGYLEFNYMVEKAKAVITDSGGITEETSVMRVPCITLRDNTERPETTIHGTNELIGVNPDAIGPTMEVLFSGKWKNGGDIEKWDGKTADRIVKHLLTLFP
ncbi:MAG: UDP-N-acetylglucosamine 2-epimerase (non-hydrolyzing) [Saprospiraceae bacterium]|jgi:UDP-N-acetylglucosamine 2-epimerase (non-hydrolysing)